MPAWMKWAVALLIGFAIIVIGFRFAGVLLNIFFVLNCLVLIVVVLLQSGKAADLAGAFGGAGSQTAFGPRGAANVLSRATTWCAIMFMVCAFALALRTEKATGGPGGSVLQKVSKPAPRQTQPLAPPVPQSHDALPPPSQPTGQQPAAQPPAQQTPGPAASQPASAPPKKQ